ncbi:MAG: hypothetical protein BGO01_09085 [Armatimonadetes bacterium 55-13]|nr:hypothetical protein [Armatimonadota bacterium]OJU62166.1 MAG: hypothetical protein BGO01_09085 [Armatimonadetes bacterium 55-13]
MKLLAFRYKVYVPALAIASILAAYTTVQAGPTKPLPAPYICTYQTTGSHFSCDNLAGACEALAWNYKRWSVKTYWCCYDASGAYYSTSIGNCSTTPLDHNDCCQDLDELGTWCSTTANATCASHL